MKCLMKCLVKCSGQSWSLALLIFFLAAPALWSQTKRLSIETDWLLGRLEYAKDSRFVQLGAPYTERKGSYLHRQAYSAFRKMHSAAAKQGMQLKILSAARNFRQQKAIWEAKWRGERRVKGLQLNKAFPDPLERARYILRYSSMPATSRHHWGSEIDLNALENSYFMQGKGRRLYLWLRKNAARFGFCQPYSARRAVACQKVGQQEQKSGSQKPEYRKPEYQESGSQKSKYRKSCYQRSGYEEERWHWSYLPIARPLTKAYLRRIGYKEIDGFSGAQTARPLRVIELYVAGIAKNCL